MRNNEDHVRARHFDQSVRTQMALAWHFAFAVGSAGFGALLAAFFDFQGSPDGSGLVTGVLPAWIVTLALVLPPTYLWCAIARCGSYRGSVGVGLVFGLTFNLVLIRWMSTSIGVGAWLALAATQACWFGLLALAWRALRGRKLAALQAGALWAGIEAVRGTWPLGGMPWGRLGFATMDTHWQPALAVVGVTGVGVLVAGLGVVLGQLIDQSLPGCRPISRAGVWRDSPGLATPVARPRGLAAFAFLCALGVWTLSPLVAPSDRGVDPSTRWRVGVVQPGVPGDVDVPAHHREITAQALAATKSLGTQAALDSTADGRPLDLVVWPENATTVDPKRDSQTQETIRAALRAGNGTPLLVGGIIDGPAGQDDPTAFNRATLYATTGSKLDEYTKRHLVPFGEYVPWRSVIGDWSSQFDRVPRDMVPGGQQDPMDIGGVRVANAICFDVAYDEVIADQVRNGAQVVVVQTSNATFFGTSQLGQQLQITRARAVETGRSVVVAALNGVSAAIGPNGEVLATVGAGPPATLRVDVPLGSQMTPAVRYQRPIMWAVLLVSVVSLLVSMLASLRCRFGTRWSGGGSALRGGR